MDILEMFYQNPPKNLFFQNRKQCIENTARILIKGAINSGKSALGIEWLNQNATKEQILWVNLDDLRCDEKEICQNLVPFLKANSKIKFVFLDGLRNDTNLPDFSQFYEISLLISTCDKSINLDNFKQIYLNNLDFEEFIAFYPKNFDISTTFSNFINFGNGLNNTKFDVFEINKFLQSLILSKLNEIQRKIFAQCIAYTHRNFSTFLLYKDIKQNDKTSKNSVYFYTQKLQNEGYINLVSKFQSPNSAKKLYLSDFAFFNAFSVNKNFNAVFANIIYCELLKIKCEIFYDDGLDFIVPKLEFAVLVIPFRQSDLIFLQFKKLIKKLQNLGIFRLIVISMSNKANFQINNVKCEIMPFWEFSASL